MIIPKMLLHICCAPCSIPVIKSLEEKNFAVTGFWYNPNIWPREEYERRREALSQYERIKDLSVIYDDDWESEISPDFSSDKRCYSCYEKRLLRTIETAKKLSFDFFTTTLLVSLYQKHGIIRDLAEKSSHDYGVNFYYQDFRPLFYSGKEEVNRLGLYHQRYCGCKPSIKEAEETRKRQRTKRKHYKIEF